MISFDSTLSVSPFLALMAANCSRKSACLFFVRVFRERNAEGSLLRWCIWRQPLTQPHRHGYQPGRTKTEEVVTLETAERSVRDGWRLVLVVGLVDRRLLGEVEISPETLGPMAGVDAAIVGDNGVVAVKIENLDAIDGCWIAVDTPFIVVRELLVWRWMVGGCGLRTR